MNIVEFFLKWRNKFLDFDGVNGPQCVDVTKQYFVDVLRLPPFKGNAIDYWTDIPGFKRIANSWFSYPKPGDIIIWNTNVNPFGHIAIVNWVRSFDFGSFEQNFPIGSPCHYQEHNYKNVLGWLRPLPITGPSVPKVPLKLAFLGQNLPGVEFLYKVMEYSSNKVKFEFKDYGGAYNPGQGMITQEQSYAIVDLIKPTEKFVFIFYTPNATSSFYASYYYPAKDCVITTCPWNDPRSLSFEFAHQIQMFYNTHRGSNMPVQIVDSNFPTDELIRSKYDSVSQYYQ